MDAQNLQNPLPLATWNCFVGSGSPALPFLVFLDRVKLALNMAYASEPVSTCVNCSVTPPARVGPYLLAEWLWKVSASRPIFCSISTINFNLWLLVKCLTQGMLLFGLIIRWPLSMETE